MRTCFLILISLVSLAQAQQVDSQEVTKNDVPNLYIDCHSCDMSHIRSELDYVNYVIDHRDADIFIMITRESTGSNGHAHTLSLEGRNKFKGMQDTLVYVTNQEMSKDDVRQTNLKWLKLGLVRYLTHTPLAQNLSVSFKQSKILEQPEDRWDYWVFKASMRGWLNGQSTYQSMNFWGNVSANRVTEAWKIRISLHGNYHEDTYTYDSSTYASYSRSKGVYALLVKSVSDHFSAGISAGISASSYSNLERSFYANPTIEYNIFPYSQSTRREFRFKYQVGYDLNYYNEITIYDKTDESLLAQSLEIEYSIKQSWGSANLELTGSHYLHDISKNRLDLDGEVSLKLFKGFSLTLDGNYAMIRDQLGLPAGGATQEEILLHRQELATQYQYRGSMGISYTFGSIYNNIVNPRF
ncbi:MAG: hypothetical protein U9Q77_06345 [Candidatus Marinimicrobia bacterium]|nr:hypothetical protein [Candidatus Neomarinimicrobiota bacterium]